MKNKSIYVAFSNQKGGGGKVVFHESSRPAVLGTGGAYRACGYR